MSETSDQNKANTVEFFMKVFNEGDVGLIGDLLSPDYKYNGQPSSVKDNAGWVQALRSEFSGLVFTIEAILAEDDKVALRWRMTAPANSAGGAGYVTATNILSFVGGQAISNDQTPQKPEWTPL
ncbi:MAG: nuclear transport factor 2 family protein [Acetobacteraceae bacterium]|nr:nuclear transport factor 2 family protein [Acetobacteraceae bacterium]